MFFSYFRSQLREQNLLARIPDALQIRCAQKCCALGDDNPYDNFQRFRKEIKKIRESTQCSVYNYGSVASAGSLIQYNQK